MYVLMEYKVIKNDGKGNKTSAPNRVLDYSEDITKFEHLIPSKKTFEIVGHCTASRMYRGKEKMLLDLKILSKSKGASKIIEMIREKSIDDVLSI